MRRVCFYLAMFQREAKAPFEKIVGPLNKAIEVKPDYLDARIELAHVNLNEKKYTAALLALNGLKNVPPEKAAAIFNTRAYAYLEIGQTDDARTSAETARKWARTEADKQQTEQLISYLDAREQSEKQRKAYLAEREARANAAANSAPENRAAADTAPAAAPSPPFGERNPFVKPGEKLERAEGIAKNIDCSGKFPRFQIQSGGKLLTFDMAEPDKIWLRHEGSDTMDFRCGPQKAFTVGVGYIAGKPGQVSLGILRELDF